MADLLHELGWLEAKVQAGLTFDLTDDFDEALGMMLADDSRQRTLRLLDESLRRDIHFIANSYTTHTQVLIQCLWNTAWWYDCEDAVRHYAAPWEPEERELSTLLKTWRAAKDAASPSFFWLRSLAHYY